MRVSLSRFFLELSLFVFDLTRFFLDFPRASLRNSDPGRNSGLFFSNTLGVSAKTMPRCLKIAQMVTQRDRWTGSRQYRDTTSPRDMVVMGKHGILWLLVFGINRDDPGCASYRLHCQVTTLQTSLQIFQTLCADSNYGATCAGIDRKMLSSSLTWEFRRVVQPMFWNVTGNIQKALPSKFHKKLKHVYIYI